MPASGHREKEIRVPKPRPAPRRAAQAVAVPAAERKIRLGAIENRLGFALQVAQEASFQAFARRVGQADMRPGRYAILHLINENPGLSQTALGQAAGRDKSTLTPALADLERRGLILRSRTPGDRRSYALTLTEAGRKVMQELALHARAHDRLLDRLIGKEEKASFLAMLRRITAGLG